MPSAMQPQAASADVEEEPQRPRDARLRTPPKPCGAVRVGLGSGLELGFLIRIAVRIGSRVKVRVWGGFGLAVRVGAGHLCFAAKASAALDMGRTPSVNVRANSPARHCAGFTAPLSAHQPSHAVLASQATRRAPQRTPPRRLPRGRLRFGPRGTRTGRRW